MSEDRLGAFQVRVRRERFQKWHDEAWMNTQAPREIERWQRRFIELHDAYMAATQDQKTGHES